MTDDVGFRTSPQQAAAWESSLKTPANFQSIFSARVTGEIDPERFREALAALVREREILRTIIKNAPGTLEPVQIIADEDDGSWWVAPEEDATLLRLDASSSPTFRTQLTPLEAGDVKLTLWAPTVLADWTGLRNLAHACLALYCNAGCRSADSAQADASEEEPLQYADVAEWLHELQSGDEAAEGISYWKQKQLAAEPWPFVPLCTVDASPFDPAVVATTLSEPLCESLYGYCTEERPITAVLLACWQILLARLSGEEAFHLMVECDGRGYEGLEAALGVFQNSCPLGTSLSSSETFASALQATSRDLTALGEYQEAFDWAHIPGGQELRNELTGPRGLAANVGFEHVDLGPSFSCAGISAISDVPSTYRHPFLLRLLCATRLETEAGRLSAELRFQYDGSKTDASQVARIAAEFETLLKNALEQPDRSIAELDILPEAQRNELRELCGSSDAYDPSLTAHGWFEQLVDQSPNSAALIALGTAANETSPNGLEQRVTYAELDQRANRIAHRLLKSGIEKGDLVVICCPRSVNMVASILGILKAGAAYVPMDPEYPHARSQFMLEDTGSKVLLACASVVDGLPAHSAEVLLLHEVIADAANDTARPDVSVTGDDLAYLIYTSGSTGTPKGVELLHRNLVHSTDARHRYYGPDEKRFLLLSSYAFDSSIAGIFGTLLEGSTLVLPEDGVRRDLSRIAELIETHGVTDLLWLPSSYRRLLDQESERLASLRRVVVAGEACQPELIQRHRTTLPDVELHNEYGPTEATVWTTVFNTANHVDGLVPIGHPVSRARVIVVNPSLQMLPLGVTGEICIAGDGVARGYHDRLELTSDKFIELDGVRVYRSGDLGCLLADGTVLFHGRRDAQVKINGYRIELGEIESAFCAHPRIAQAIVEPRLRPGADAQQLVAYVTVGPPPEDSRESSGESDVRGMDGSSVPEIKLTELRGFVLEHLPHYMLPTHIELLSELPRLPNGKVDRKRLPEPGTSARRQVDAAGDARPRSPVEEAIMDIWSDVLDVPRPRPSDNFFDLGGHSLKGLQVVALANKRGLSITPAHLFQYPVLADLAAVAGTRHAIDTPERDACTLISLQTVGHKKPLFLIHSVPGDLLHYGHLVHHLGRERPIYGFQALGLESIKATHRDIPSMAAHYVRVMTEFQPEGPYHLAGWCFGGTVAIEMARTLRAQGRQVGLLGMLEAEPWPPPNLATALYHMRALAEKRKDVFRYLRYKITRLFGGNFQGDGAEDFSLEYDQGPFKNRAHIYRVNMAAQVGWLTRPLPGKLTLFKAATCADDRLAYGNYGWERFVTSVDSHTVPGRHEDLMRGDNAKHLAGLMRRCLDSS